MYCLIIYSGRVHTSKHTYYEHERVLSCAMLQLLDCLEGLTTVDLAEDGFPVFRSIFPQLRSMRSGDPLASFFNSAFRLRTLAPDENRLFLNLSMIVRRGLWLSDGGSCVM